jgi:NAD(P)-dependent dehydrogenase (short-subunit alcohol dehydrogenase family)
MATLTGRHALITGGGTGVGAAIARALSAEGAAVTLVGRRRAALEAMASTLPRAAVAAADITKAADCAAMVAAARAAHGPIDIVIANAGAAESAPFAAVDLALWQRMIDVNLTGTFLTVQSALPDLLREADDAEPLRRIVLIASTAGQKGYAYVAPYVAAKHGVVGLARALSVEFAQTPLTVNAVCPGFTDTPMLNASLATIMEKTGRTADQARAALTRTNPQGRLIEPDEIAATVQWLCSAAARSVTGQCLSISGGET